MDRKSNSALHPIQASIEYRPLPRFARIGAVSDDDLEHDDFMQRTRGRRAVLLGDIVESGLPDDIFAETPNPTAEGPRFWEKVQQLSFAFQEEDWPGVQRFYHGVGPLGYRRPDGPMEYEPLIWCQGVLRWFQELTSLVRWIKDDRLSPIWEKFGPPRLSKQVYPVSIVRPFAWTREYALEFAGWHGRKGTEWGWFTPQDDEQLVVATWQVVTHAVQDGLSRIKLEPLTADYRDSKAPMVAWGFKAEGALHAAFLQWWFQEVAYLNIRTCAAEGCDRPVPPHRDQFCSKQCASRERQRRHRADKKGVRRG